MLVFILQPQVFSVPSEFSGTSLFFKRLQVRLCMFAQRVIYPCVTETSFHAARESVWSSN